MLKRDICDRLYSKAYERIKTENPTAILDNNYLTALWFSIYGVLNSEGEEAAEKYVSSANISKRLSKDIHAEMRNGY